MLVGFFLIACIDTSRNGLVLECKFFIYQNTTSYAPYPSKRFLVLRISVFTRFSFKFIIVTVSVWRTVHMILIFTVVEFHCKKDAINVLQPLFKHYHLNKKPNKRTFKCPRDAGKAVLPFAFISACRQTLVLKSDTQSDWSFSSKTRFK